MGKPAARISDHHTCPKKTGKIPHVGGPVVAGSPNVLIGGLPAARVGDMLMCVGPPDSIAKGSSSVFINGKPAARLGDKTSHNGVIVAGEGSVLIGDAGIIIPPATSSSENNNTSNSDGRSSSTPVVIPQQMTALRSAAERAQGICQVCEDTNEESNNNAAQS